MKTYWAIEDKKGELVLGYGNLPILWTTRKDTITNIDKTADERVVKVEIRKVEK